MRLARPRHLATIGTWCARCVWLCVWLCAWLGCGLGLGGVAQAQTGCPVPAGASPALAAHSAERRLRFIRTEMGYAAHRSRAWAFTWGSLYAAQAAAYLTLLPEKPDRDDRIDLAVSAASSLLGVATLLISPPVILGNERRLDRLLRGPAPAGGICTRVSAAERLLSQAAARDEFSSGPLLHVGTALFNIGLAVLLGFGFQHWSAAGTTVAVGMVVGELMNVTRPIDSISAWQRYRGGLVDLGNGRGNGRGIGRSIGRGLAGGVAGQGLSRLSLVPVAGRDSAALRVGFQF